MDKFCINSWLFLKLESEGKNSTYISFLFTIRFIYQTHTNNSTDQYNTQHKIDSFVLK